MRSVHILRTSPEKPFQFWECISGLPQYEATKSYMPKEPDELGLRQAELVIVLQTEDGEELQIYDTERILCIIACFIN